MANDNFVYYPTYIKEWRQICSTATPEQVYQLVMMCLDYAEGIEVPEPEDAVVKLCFTMVSGGIDRGAEKVSKKSKSARYSRYCGTCNSEGTEPLPYKDWSDQIDSKRKKNERQRTSTDVNERQRQSTSVDNHNLNLNLNLNNNLNNNHNQNLAPAAPPPSGGNSKPEKYLPQRWEFDIPKAYRGRFEREDDYYKYAQTHRDEVIAELEKEEQQKKR